MCEDKEFTETFEETLSIEQWAEKFREAEKNFTGFNYIDMSIIRPKGNPMQDEYTRHTKTLEWLKENGNGSEVKEAVEWALEELARLRDLEYYRTFHKRVGP